MSRATRHISKWIEKCKSAWSTRYNLQCCCTVCGYRSSYKCRRLQSDLLEIIEPIRKCVRVQHLPTSHAVVVGFVKLPLCFKNQLDMSVFLSSPWICTSSHAGQDHALWFFRLKPGGIASSQTPEIFLTSYFTLWLHPDVVRQSTDPGIDLIVRLESVLLKWSPINSSSCEVGWTILYLSLAADRSFVVCSTYLQMRPLITAVLKP